MSAVSSFSHPRRASAALVAALVIALAGSLTVTSADARLGGGGSFGSRGSRTFSMPSATPTAPRVSPFTRSTTPSFAPSNGFSRPGLFGGGGFGRGLLGGFLGAGLFGLLFGGGFGGGLGGGMSIIGLLLQFALLFFAFRFAMSFFGNRQAAFGGGSSFGFGGSAGAGGMANRASAGMGTPQGTPITIGPQDYQAFEQRLIQSQAAYSNGDVSTLRRLATPEMSGNFEQELAGNDRQGVVNKISDVRLQSGDLSEAWRENGSDYATVAMRFSLLDTTIDKRTGNIVEGDPRTPQTVTEVWTFTRPSGAPATAWLLSGIQQA